MNRRTLLRHLSQTAATSALVPAALATSACEQPQAKPKEIGVKDVTFLDWEATLEGLPTETVLKNFQAKTQTVKLTIDTLGQNYEEKMRTLLAAGTPYDIHRVNDDYVRGNGTKGLMADLMPYLKRD